MALLERLRGFAYASCLAQGFELGAFGAFDSKMLLGQVLVVRFPSPSTPKAEEPVKEGTSTADRLANIAGVAVAAESGGASCTSKPA